jgi:hypothetical protein
VGIGAEAWGSLRQFSDENLDGNPHTAHRTQQEMLGWTHDCAQVE